MNEMNPNSRQNQYASENKIQALSFEDERKLVMASMCHPSGFMIRLPLFSGITLSEMLALRWKHVDFVRFQIVIESELELRGNVPYCRPATAPRCIPLPPHVMQDLIDWHQLQLRTFHYNCAEYFYDQPIAKAAFGDFFDFNSMEALCYELCVNAGISPVPYSALRHTFAVRALEQGMYEYTLNSILGNPNAAADYLPLYESTRASHGYLLETLLTVNNSSVNDLAFPLVITPLEDGKIELHAPDFPDATCITENIIEGLINVSGSMKETWFCSSEPIVPTPIMDVPASSDAIVTLLPITR